MKTLLHDLKNEALHFNTKSIGPIGFDYRRRTKIERLILLVLKKYCEQKFNYNIGGLNYNHQKLFTDFTKDQHFIEQDISIVKKAFAISDLISNLSSSDPYTVEEVKNRLGGSIDSVLRNLSKEVELFVESVKQNFLQN